MNGICFPLHTFGVFFTVRVPWFQKGLVNALPVSPNTFFTFFRSSCYVLLRAGVLFFFMTLKMNPSVKKYCFTGKSFWLLRKLRSFYSRINLKKKGRWLFCKTSNNLIMICQVHRNLNTSIIRKSYIDIVWFLRNISTLHGFCSLIFVIVEWESFTVQMLENGRSVIKPTLILLFKMCHPRSVCN